MRKKRNKKEKWTTIKIIINLNKLLIPSEIKTMLCYKIHFDIYYDYLMWYDIDTFIYLLISWSRFTGKSLASEETWTLVCKLSIIQDWLCTKEWLWFDLIFFWGGWCNSYPPMASAGKIVVENTNDIILSHAFYQLTFMTTLCMC